MSQLLVLGDDLTGSNATGALYARFGLCAVSVNAPLEPDAPCFRAESGIDALVINLGTRHAPPSHAGRAVRRAIELAAAFRGSGWRSPRPEAKSRLSQPPARNT